MYDIDDMLKSNERFFSDCYFATNLAKIFLFSGILPRKMLEMADKSKNWGQKDDKLRC